MNEGAASQILVLGRQIGGDSKVKATQGLRTCQNKPATTHRTEAVKEI